jgi:hypothetical protein
MHPMTFRRPSPRPPVLIAGTILASGALIAFAGPINPPAGPVTSTLKTLTEVEPRTAINAANTPGDANSLFRIAQPGSYYLTGNITGVANKSGIEIAASGVTIDLMGFDVAGVSGSLDGIVVSDSFLTNITIRGGSIRNWGNDGIDLASAGAAGCAVVDIRASDNTATGIFAGPHSVVTGCTAFSNGVNGIFINAGGSITGCAADLNTNLGFSTGPGVTVSGCAANSNTSHGFSLGAGCTITGCIARVNSGNGIAAGNTCAVAGCAAVSNGLSGIAAGSSATISNCTADANGGSSTGLSEGILAGDGSTISGCTSQNNTSLLFGGVGDMGMGFRTGNRCIVKDCTASRNRGHGFRLLTSSRISGCSASENGSGSTLSAGIYAVGADNQIDGNQTNGSDFGVQVIAAGNIITRNVATGNTANYNFVADNIYGPIIDRRIPTTVPTTAAVSGFAAPSTLGSTDPSANFSH